MARLSAHGEEIVRLRKVSPGGGSSVTVSVRTDKAVLIKTKQGTYDSGWKIRRRELLTPVANFVADLKEKGWEEVKGHG